MANRITHQEHMDQKLQAGIAQYTNDPEVTAKAMELGHVPGLDIHNTEDLVSLAQRIQGGEEITLPIMHRGARPEHG